jgi:PAS domain S-box-containing protein
VTATDADSQDPAPSSEALVTSILDCVAQPVWMVDHDGLIRFANPSAVAALGYDDLSELRGKPSHQTIHYKRPGGSPFPAEECPMLLPRTSGATIHRADDWFVRRDGSMFPVEYWSAPIDVSGGRGAVVAFQDLTEARAADVTGRRRAEEDLLAARQRLKAFADEQAALRRVATLVAGGAPQAEVFAVVAREVSACLEVPLISIVRFEAGGMATHVGFWGRENPFPVGTSWRLDEHGAAGIVYRSGRAARVEYANVPGEIAAKLAREAGIRSAVAVPINVNGQPWGTMMALSTATAPQPATTEAQLADFTELVATAIANAHARHELQQLADEQAALREVATLVAQGAEPRAVFGAVCEATGRLIGAASVNLAQFTPDEHIVTLAGWSQRGTHIPPGTRLSLMGQPIDAVIKQTLAPARVDDYEGQPGPLAARLRELGIRSEVGAPVIVDGSVWGTLVAGMDDPEPLPIGAELRVASFAELAGTAISNAAARAELIASRARIVAAADAARQQVTRDLHDGAQQQFVNTIINLQLAQQKWSSAPERAQELIDRALGEARAGVDGLREVAAGIHPAILTHRGLAAALDALAARLPVPVELDVFGGRLPEAIEASIYFFCSEALTNVVKHARADSAWVRVACEDARCTIEVRDDGVGGAEARLETSGLIGLRDRIGALKGGMQVSSPASAGTSLRAWIPLPREPVTPEAGLTPGNGTRSTG